jgi:membrane protease YdiL (CAAX protease family)
MVKSSASDPGKLISDKRRKSEILAVCITGIGKLIFMDVLQWRLPFILVSVLGWAAYVISRSKKIPGVLSYWGFRIDNFKKVTYKILPFGLVSVITFFIVGYQRGTINLTWHIIPILILYPIWGVIQQFLVIGLVAGNLQDLKENKLNKVVIVLLTASLFGLVHYPYYWLMAGTFILALLYGFIYLKNRNVYVMGLFHGWLGALFFYTVVNRDPFAEVFMRLGL